MLAKHLVAALVASAVIATPVLVTGPAVAQRADQSGASSGSQLNSGNWLTQEKTGQWRASKLSGLNVYNNNNEKIGDIKEVLVDQSGRVDAVVIGVGGFLGMGEHEVAVPFSQLRWSNKPASNTTGAGNTSNRNSAGGRAQSSPDHAVLNMTKDQLKAAPEFHFAR